MMEIDISTATTLGAAHLIVTGAVVYFGAKIGRNGKSNGHGNSKNGNGAKYCDQHSRMMLMIEEIRDNNREEKLIQTIRKALGR